MPGADSSVIPRKLRVIGRQARQSSNACEAIDNPSMAEHQIEVYDRYIIGDRGPWSWYLSEILWNLSPSLDVS